MNPRTNPEAPRPSRAGRTPAAPSRPPASALFPIASPDLPDAQLAGGALDSGLRCLPPLPGALGNDAPSRTTNVLETSVNSFARRSRQAVERFVCVVLLLRLPLLHDEQHGTKEFELVGKLIGELGNV